MDSNGGLDSMIPTSYGILQQKPIGAVINHIDTIVDGIVYVPMTITFEYNSPIAETKTVYYYFSSDAAGEFQLGSGSQSFSLSSGTNTVAYTGLTYVSSAQYLWMKIDGEANYKSSNQFSSISVTINHIDTISSPQVYGDVFYPQVTFEVVSSSAATITFNWRVRNSLHAVRASGSESLSVASGTSTKTLTTPQAPSEQGSNYDFGVSYGSVYVTSNHFEITL